MKIIQTFALTFEKLFLTLSQASRLGVSWLVITNHIMNDLRKSISLMAAITMIAACANTGKKDIIGENIQNAEVQLSALYEESQKDYLKKADKIIESLSSPAYRAEHGTNGGFILMHSVTSFPANAGVDVPLNYADYYFLEALIRKMDLKK